MVVEIMNCTAHPVVITLPDGKSITFTPSNQRARINQDQVIAGTLDVTDEMSIPVVNNVFKNYKGLPDPSPNRYYIVSMACAEFLKDIRDDLIVPNTSPMGAIRDEYNEIIAVKSFIKIGDLKK